MDIQLLNTKQEYSEALQLTEFELETSELNLIESQKQKRKGLTSYLHSIIKHDLKSKDAQEAYVIKSDAQYETVYYNYDINLHTYHRLLRQRENIIKLMSFDQSQMKLI